MPLLVAMAFYSNSANCKAAGGGGGTVEHAPVDRDSLTADDYKKMGQVMEEHVAANEPSMFLVIGIILAPLTFILITLLIMSKLKILVFKDEDERIDLAKRKKTYSSLDKGFFNCEYGASPEDERYQINWDNFTNSNYSSSSKN